MKLEECKDYCVLKAFDVSESDIENCKSLVDTDDVFIDVSEKYKDVTIILINKNASEIKFNEILNNVVNCIKDELYADYETSLEEQIVKKATDKNIKVGTAESITGGMVASSIVNIPGSSHVLYEGFVTYATAAKVRRLHVKQNTLDNYGPISLQTCEEMLQGVLANKDITLAVATTGCAGPDSDEFDTPVGVAYIGVASNTEHEVKKVELDGNRDTIRKTVNNIALFMLLKYIEKYD